MMVVYWQLGEVRGYSCNQGGVLLDRRPWTVKEERDVGLTKMSWTTALVGMPLSHRGETFAMELK